MKKIIIFTLIFITLLSNIILGYYPDTVYVWSEDTIQTSAEEASGDFLELSSESAILVEQTSGKVLYDKSSHEKLRPASVTKVMTLLLIMEAIENGQITYETKIGCSENASSMGGSQIWLEVRRRINCS